MPRSTTSSAPRSPRRPPSLTAGAALATQAGGYPALFLILVGTAVAVGHLAPAEAVPRGMRMALSPGTVTAISGVG
jgi:hypothetical protein